LDERDVLANTKQKDKQKQWLLYFRTVLGAANIKKSRGSLFATSLVERDVLTDTYPQDTRRSKQGPARPRWAK
jgi:hypothetical protein